MFIDAHAHACGELGTDEGILNYLNSNGLDKIILCPGEQNSNHNYPVPMIADVFPSSKIGFGFNRIIQHVVKASGVAATLDEQNIYVSGLARKYPNHILQAYWLNPLDPQGINRMDSFYQKTPFCMVKLHQGWHDFDIQSSAVFAETVIWAKTYCLPIFIHLLSNTQCHALIRVANDNPSCNFIVGHMIGFDIIAPCLKHDNVHFDISAPFMIPKHYLQAAVKLWGGNRLILGSDTPYGSGNIKKNIKRIEQLAIGDIEKANIFGANMEQLLSFRRQH